MLDVTFDLQKCAWELHLYLNPDSGLIVFFVCYSSDIIWYLVSITELYASLCFSTKLAQFHYDEQNTRDG